MEYTSLSSGIEVEIRKINYYKVFAISNSAEEELRAQGEPIDAPTYKVPIGDDFQEHQHVHELDDDGEVINSTLDTDEDHAAWEAHLAAQRKLARLYMDRLSSYALRNGVVVDMDADDWEDQQIYDGITVPENPNDKYLHYLHTEVFPDVIEREEIASQIVNMSVPVHNTEVQEAVQEFFRRSLETESEG